MRYIAYGLAILAALLTVSFATGYLPRDATASHNETNDMNVLQMEQTSGAKALRGPPGRGLSVGRASLAGEIARAPTSSGGLVPSLIAQPCSNEGGLAPIGWREPLHQPSHDKGENTRGNSPVMVERSLRR